MSAIASFTLLPKSKLDGLREAATPKKRLLGASEDIYHDYRQQYGRAVADYEWSGYILVTLLVYLQKHNIDLMRSDYSELSTCLSKQRGTTCFILTDEHKQSYLSQLSPDSFSAQLLCDYYNAFNSANESEIGQPMLDGIEAIRESLKHLDADSIILFSIE